MSVEGGFGVFADSLIARDLPDLPDERRRETVVFVCGRAREVPTPLRLGVMALSAGAATGQRYAGVDRTTEFLRATRLPLVSELARMVRSLGFTFVWETWPTSSPTGSPS